MNDPLRNSLSIETRQFFQQVVVLQQRRSAWPRGLGVLVIAELRLQSSECFF